TPFRFFMRDLFYERMRGQKFREAAAKSACAVAMNDAHARRTRQGCIVDEFVHAAGGFLDRTTDDVDFLCCGFVARLRVNCDPSRNGATTLGLADLAGVSSMPTIS